MAGKKLSDCQNIGYKVICDIRAGKVNKAKAFIARHGIEYSATWSEGYVLLCEALKHHHKKLTEYLLTFENVKINNPSKFQMDTPLHLAALHGYKDIFTTLLAHGADINALNTRGRTPLDVAVDSKHCSIIEVLLPQENVDLSSAKWPNYPLLHSAAESSLMIVQNLLDKGLEVDFIINGLTPLHRAAFSSCFPVVKCLVEHKADVNAVSTSKNFPGFTPLHFAAKKSNVEVIKFLIENGAHINFSSKNGSTPFNLVLLQDNEEVVNVFLKYGVDINGLMKDQLTPLQFAIRSHSALMVAVLLKNGADLKVLDCKGRNALHFTLSCGIPPLEILEMLIKYGEDVNALDEYTRESKKTLLHLLADDNYLYGFVKLEIIQFLIKNGANVDAVDATGATPIFYSVRRNQCHWNFYGTTISFLEEGANVNAKDLEGKTPLHVACELGSEQNVNILLKYGADINSRCLKNRLPIEYCFLALAGVGRYDRNAMVATTLEIIHKIFKHAIVLKLANLYIDPKYYELQLNCFHTYTRNTIYEYNHSDEFKSELNNLKKKYIACNLTFYDLLSKNPHELVTFKKNSLVIKSIQSVNIMEEYPFYGGIIVRNLTEASTRMKLIEESKDRIYSVFPVPIEVAENIFKFLNNDHFYNFIRAL